MERRPVARLTSMAVTESPMRTHCAGGRSRMSRHGVRSRVRLHQLGPAGDAADDGVDQVSAVVVTRNASIAGSALLLTITTGRPTSRQVSRRSTARRRISDAEAGRPLGTQPSSCLSIRLTTAARNAEPQWTRADITYARPKVRAPPDLADTEEVSTAISTGKASEDGTSLPTSADNA